MAKEGSSSSPVKPVVVALDRHVSSLELPASTLRIVYLNKPDKNKVFPGNQVITAKYNIWTFVPAFCYERFTQVSNFYFLLVGVGQVIPAITSTFGLPYSWLVLGVVLFVDAIFTGVEDYHRHVADAVMNAREARVFDSTVPTRFRTTAWKDIVVGDVLQIKKYEAVPADILLLAVHEADPSAPVGMCFIETKSLDGETNLKIRQALPCTFAQLQDPAAIGHLPGRVACEHPNHDVNNFMGRFESADAATMIPIDLKNVVLRGCVIRNTPFVYGLVLNTGSDTKIMQASHKTPTKLSKAIEIINRGNVILLVIMVLLCVVGAVWDHVAVGWTPSPTYLALNDASIRDGLNAFRGDAMGICIAFGYYWVLISSFVPITLYVSIAIVKSYQAYFMNRDLGMYYAPSDTPAAVRNADLNDELGQITHIFSDKTGTLTANEMNFRKMSINGRSYGRGCTDIGRATAVRTGRMESVTDLATTLSVPATPHPPHVEFFDPHGDFAKDRGSQDQSHTAAIDAFLTHLSVCHSVVLERDDSTNTTNFSASSPDELALVAGAAFFGYTFCERANGRAVVNVVEKGPVEFQMLELIEFTSTRKRMSVVVRSPDGRILVLTKGADSIVFPRLRDKGDTYLKTKTVQHMELYAEEGLRTLVLAQREISPDWYLDWSAQYRQALSNLDESAPTYKSDLMVVERLEDEMECELELLGATAVEDRLQTGVPLAISSVMQAGIKVWVLTGDKEETAINIAFACQLITNDMDRLVLNMDLCKSNPETLKSLMLDKAHRTRTSLFKQRNSKSMDALPSQALVIDGPVLTMVYHYPLLKFLFLELAQQCAAVICCRVSPKQKAEIVALVKNNVKNCRTLSIGDGANDVSMIQEAHVGVGISGHEGMQAVNASDFAIAQFAFLQRLLLVHGHWNYRRMSKLVLYVVYKNILCWFALYVLSLSACGSGTVFMNYNWLNGYNVFWTFLPIMIVAIMEQETSAKVAQDHPGLYHIGPQGDLLSVKIMAEWVFEALYEGVVCALVPVYLLGPISSTGYAFTMYDCGGLCYTALIVVGWTKLALNAMSWNGGMHFAMWVTVPFWFFSAIILSNSFPSDSSDHVFPHLFTLPEFWMLLFLCVVLALVRDFVYKAWKREWRPEYYHILQESERYKLTTNTEWSPPLHPRNYKPFRVDFSHYLTSELHALPDAPWLELQQPKHRGFAFSIQPSENRHFNPMRGVVLAPLKRAVVRVLSPRAASKEEIAFWDARKKDGHVYEYQRYQVFVGWSAPFGLTDPCPFATRDMREGGFQNHGHHLSLDEWAVDTTLGEADTKHWEYATKFSDFRKVDVASTRWKKPTGMHRRLNKMVGRCVRRRRWVFKGQVDPNQHVDAATIDQEQNDVIGQVQNDLNNDKEVSKVEQDVAGSVQDVVEAEDADNVPQPAGADERHAP
ncbi:hypothetical protein H310_05365 [Aphanomyces invadans]|uniref:Phospholipid-transporting ATPase n=1 Tax=Aphanomyces invadans TaxID=157072 RepID=A0A024U9P9_9STRA|nr:hypothetical protein H310_05365 [Aphanomyces invadans]ETW02900.1 hypothetical protein H310_05365 [Aphanomyces invadans]|eukprot:XP_008868284.1 hypothetical protein H310_05365 [Aphanomyces invadans]